MTSFIKSSKHILIGFLFVPLFIENNKMYDDVLEDEKFNFVLK